MSSSKSFFENKRAWSRIKDEVLKTYLAPYLAKVSKTKRPIIVADCFAGKGRFDNGEPGSPLIIAEAISFQLSDSTSPAIKGVFIEKKYFGNLMANIPDSPWLYPLEGDYEERMEFFVKQYEPRDQNLFLYVDPYGIKSVLFSHFEKIQKKGFRTVELLLNLNSFGFLREACRLLKCPVLEAEQEHPDVYEEDVNTPERLDEIAGGDYWRKIIDKYYSNQIKMAEAEGLFIAEYCERLRKIFRHVVNIPVKAKLSNIPKYRIIFGTDHDDGLLLMVDNMNKRWASFREEARDKQSPLFECDFPDPSKQQACWNVEEKIFSLIDRDIELKELLIRLVQEFGINFSISEFKQYLKKMENDQIDVKRFPAITPTGKPSTSWDHTKTDFTVKISRRRQWQQPLL
jgi:three-Cys-motif partner protein